MTRNQSERQEGELATAYCDASESGETLTEEWADDSKTRELVVTFDTGLLTPAVVRDEIGNYDRFIVEKSGMDPDRVAQFIDLLFQYIEVVPADEFHPYVEQAEEAIGAVDSDDVLYVACALAHDTAVWSDDSDFEEQDLVGVYSTSDVVDSFDTA
jgi:predicted nucleic acid-binding protein